MWWLYLTNDESDLFAEELSNNGWQTQRVFSVKEALHVMAMKYVDVLLVAPDFNDEDVESIRKNVGIMTIRVNSGATSGDVLHQVRTAPWE